MESSKNFKELSREIDEIEKSILTKEIVFNDDTLDLNEFEKTFKILHFNDVYNVESSSQEPKAGAARFLTLLKHLKLSHQCIVLFSGDCFSPCSCIKLYNIKF